jgi:hypothetical protein
VQQCYAASGADAAPYFTCPVPLPLPLTPPPPTLTSAEAAEQQELVLRSEAEVRREPTTTTRAYLRRARPAALRTHRSRTLSGATPYDAFGGFGTTFSAKDWVFPFKLPKRATDTPTHIGQLYALGAAYPVMPRAECTLPGADVT